MTKALLLLSEGAEEIETVVSADVLTRGSVNKTLLFKFFEMYFFLKIITNEFTLGASNYSCLRLKRMCDV